MCRNITELRGLEPPATPQEVEAAARQYVRKVSGLQKVPEAVRGEFEQAVAEVAAATAKLLAIAPARRQPPANPPPLRRPEVVARIAAKAALQNAALQNAALQ
ncbi:MAG: DUF2277 domain-containing protein [Actinomycetota bacterium]